MFRDFLSPIFCHKSFVHPNKSSIFAGMKQEIIDKINQLASQNEPFLFVINYQGDKAFIRLLSGINPEECLFDFEGRGNLSHAWKETWKEGTWKEETWKKKISEEEISETTWQIEPPLYEDYERSFNIVKSNIMAGNSYLTNLTCRVPVSCNLSLEEIFHRAKGKYKLLLRRKRTQAEDKAHLKEENIEENLTPFVCFSPETFVRIKGGRIYSYPMKGTLDASLPNAEKLLMEDRKEAAEHATIVDLIRNDLSRVAENVRVDKYRYIDVLHTNKGDILQTSSEISGRLPEDYPHHLGEILDAQLPAGSITGAPKDKTMQIIQEAEGYDRGFYTGIMGIYDHGELNSAVMIRFIEEDTSPVDFETNGEKNFKASEGKGDEASRKLYFKAGGGITSKSDCRKEYEEVIQKIYLPF
jgi:para-aminobenzoate synthetase component I